MTTVVDLATEARPQWRVVLTNPKVGLGLVIFGLFVLVALFAQPVLNATVWTGKSNIYDPRFGFDSAITHPSAPSSVHWLGTTSLGRDVFSLFTYSARPTLMVAIGAGVCIAVVSLIAGAVSAYRRGWVDGFVSHLSDAMVLLPAMLAVFILGISRSNEAFGPLQVGLSFGVIYGLGPATATVRAAAMSVMAKSFVESARVAGGGGVWMVSRHLLPHLYQHAAVQAMIGVTGAVTAEAFLTFRSAVGADYGFGMMVYDGIVWSEFMAGITATPWWVMLAGATGITLLAAAFYLLGVGMREAFDPKTRLPR